MNTNANLVLDVEGYELTSEEREIIEHPYVGGVILFSRNYHDLVQLNQLTEQIRLSSRDPILISVDHEGGRVQRFRDHFSPIPAMSIFEQLTGSDESKWNTATEMGWLMASEVIAANIDLSFAPVLDLNRVSDVIGSRSFSSSVEGVAMYAAAFIKGMKDAGMSACGKHFPGHGSVVADSHIAMPIDERDFSTLSTTDMVPFKKLISDNQLDAIMPAHVIYPAIDNVPAGFSERWLQEILRKKLGFNGVIFSDDLSMKAADAVEGYVAKAEYALKAGCNMILACNNPNGAIEILDAYSNLPTRSAMFNQNLIINKPSTLNHKALFTVSEIQKTQRWKQANRLACQIHERYS